MLRMLSFGLESIKNYRAIGSIIPSSNFTAHKIAAMVKSDIAQVIVEYGPGTGVITEALLRPGILAEGSKVIAIEQSEAMARILTKRFEKNKNVLVVQGDAGAVHAILRDHGIEKVDRVISGIPLSTIPTSEADSVIEQTENVLQPTGTFIVYQFRETAGELLRSHFPAVQQSRIWLNLPPLHLFSAQKNPSSRHAAGRG